MMEAIILAGGQGTRLQSVLPNQQKCMASVLGKPFLAYVIEPLIRQGFSRFILATGHHHAQVSAWTQQQWYAEQCVFSVEDRPLGTGGALLQALPLVNTEEVLVVNGDSLIKFDYPSLLSFHREKKATLTLISTPVADAMRFGRIEMDEQSQVIEWSEKGRPGPGYINAGVYLLSKSAFANTPITTCSFEKEIIPPLLEQGLVFAHSETGPLLDIGTPESLAQAATFMQAQTASP